MLGVLPNGILLGIEVKKEDGVLSDIQKKTIAELNKNNGFVIVVYPKDFNLLKITIDDLINSDKSIEEIKSTYYNISKNL